MIDVDNEKRLAVVDINSIMDDPRPLMYAIAKLVEKTNPETMRLYRDYVYSDDDH